MFFKSTNARRLLSRLINAGSLRQHQDRRLTLEPLEDRKLLALIGVVPQFPLIGYDFSGQVNYESASQTLAFNIDATPLQFKESATSPARTVMVDPATGTRDFQVHIQVDNAGNLIGGVDGPDMFVTGAIDLDGDSVVDVSGTLLTGEISQFGYYNSTTPTDKYDFRFTPTGGALQSYFIGKDIAVTANSEGSSFNGSFDTNFSGGAKGNIGTVAPWLSSLSGNVYLDSNNNGLFESGAGETGIPNATVTLTGTNVDGVAVNASVQTDANGAYSFTNLRPGTYSIGETQPAGYLDGLDTIGTPGGLAENDVFSNVVLSAGVNGSDNNFGELPLLPGIQLIKLTNGADNVNANLPAGSTVNWTYNVTNTGNAALSIVTLSDDAGVTPVYSSGDNGNDILDVGESWSYTGSALAIPGQYNNTGTVMATATDATGTVSITVSSSESDSYFGINPGIQIVKLTNGTDNNSAPGANITIGDTVTWMYSVINTGNVALNGVTVDDSDPTVAPALVSGDDGNGLLDLGETWIYTATGTAIAGQYANTGTAVGIDATGTVSDAVTSSDVDYYYGQAPQPATKSGYVYIDNNNDGIKQTGEAGIEGVKIILTGVNDLGQSVFITTTTDANGAYIFTNLRPGTYTVTEVQPGTSGGGGCGDHHDDGCGSHRTYMYQWCDGGTKHFELRNCDGSIRECDSSSNSSLIDNIFNELCDNDWVDDGIGWDDESLMDGLFRGCNMSDLFNMFDANDGCFAGHFADFWNGITIISGKYGSTSYLDGKDTIGSEGGIADNDVLSGIVLDWGVNGTDNNFGELLPASLSGNAYVDANNDGIKQSNEKGIARVKVTLTGIDDLGNTVLLTTVTDCNGGYEFKNLRPGTYSLTETDPDCYLDGNDAIGSQGGVAGNDVLSSIVLTSGVKGTGNNFGELKSASLSGFVYVDKNGDGDIDCRDRTLADVTVTLTGVDDLGNSVSITTVTDDNGYYVFKNLRPGTYTITETQPAGYLDGIDTIGSQGGIAGNDVFSNIVLKQGVKGINNNFSELTSASTALHEGQTATIGFWNNCRGQTLIKSLNGGCNSTQLGNWLAANFPNMYGVNAGAFNLAGKTNAQIANFFKQLFNIRCQKIDAQALAVSLAIYVTNSNLAGNVAVAYGFTVNSIGTGAATFNIGSAGEAFGVADNTTLTIYQVMQKTNDQARKGVLWDTNGNGSISWMEQLLRNMANNVLTHINETGDIG
jgi:uncharacterized repeat protein (TIGR01451 family)